MSRQKRNWITGKKALCIALLLLAAVYIYSRPTLERWLNIQLPEIPLGQEEPRLNPDLNGPEIGNGRNGSEANSEEGRFPLRRIGENEFESPAGLIYGVGPNREHRVDHVLRHLRDMPDRPTHGVFEGNRDQVLALLDEAYQLIQAQSDRVRATPSDEFRDRSEYKIRMNRRIGFMGGRNGKERGHPESTTLMLILEKNRMVTAYPTW